MIVEGQRFSTTGKQSSLPALQLLKTGDTYPLLLLVKKLFTNIEASGLHKTG